MTPEEINALLDHPAFVRRVRELAADMLSPQAKADLAAQTATAGMVTRREVMDTLGVTPEELQEAIERRWVLYDAERDLLDGTTVRLWFKDRPKRVAVSLIELRGKGEDRRMGSKSTRVAITEPDPAVLQRLLAAYGPTMRVHDVASELLTSESNVSLMAGKGTLLRQTKGAYDTASVALVSTQRAASRMAYGRQPKHTRA